MKQKLTRALIDEIRKEMPVLSQNEEKGVIGGTLYVIGEDGRVLYSNETNSDEVSCINGIMGWGSNNEITSRYIFSNIFWSIGY